LIGEGAGRIWSRERSTNQIKPTGRTLQSSQQTDHSKTRNCGGQICDLHLGRSYTDLSAPFV
jgi:hypothetical protein